MVPSGARADLAQMINIRKEVYASVRALPSIDQYKPRSLGALEAYLVTLRTIRTMLDPETRIQQTMDALELLSLAELATTLLQSKTPKPTVTGAQRKKAKKQQANLQPSALSTIQVDQECLFAWLCFFHDTAALRTSIRHLWTLYAARSLPLTHAALLTNTAIDMLRHTTATYLRTAPPVPEIPGYSTRCTRACGSFSASARCSGRGRGTLPAAVP